METYAIHKGAMIPPRKARMTLDLIRGKDVQTAEGILAVTNTKASRLIAKVLKSAVSNAVNNFGAKEAVCDKVSNFLLRSLSLRVCTSLPNETERLSSYFFTPFLLLIL